jgi:hypothetical protein
VKESKLLRLSITTAFVFCVFGFLGQSTHPLLADGALVPMAVSYSPGDANSATGSMAATKKIRMACYPARAGCVKDSDCCSGHCVAAGRRQMAGGGQGFYCTK